MKIELTKKDIDDLPDKIMYINQILEACDNRELVQIGALIIGMLGNRANKTKKSEEIKIVRKLPT